MGSLGVLDIIWRVVVAGGIALVPGLTLLTLIFGLMAVAGRQGKRSGKTKQARGTVLP